LTSTVTTEVAVMPGLLIAIVIVVLVIGLLFFAVAQMKPLKTIKVSLKATPLLVLSFEASADIQTPEQPPSLKS
jgi:hypothetical protein